MLYWTKEARYKVVQTVQFHLYEVQQQKALIYGDRNQSIGYLWGEDWLEQSTK